MISKTKEPSRRGWLSVLGWQQSEGALSQVGASLKWRSKLKSDPRIAKRKTSWRGSHSSHQNGSVSAWTPLRMGLARGKQATVLSYSPGCVLLLLFVFC